MFASSDLGTIPFVEGLPTEMRFRKIIKTILIISSLWACQQALSKGFLFKFLSAVFPMSNLSSPAESALRPYSASEDHALLIADAEIISAQAPNFRKIWLTCAVGALGLLGWSAFATSNKGFETASTSFYYTTGIANPQMVGSSTPHLRPSVDLRGRGSDFSGDDFYLSPEVAICWCWFGGNDAVFLT